MNYAMSQRHVQNTCRSQIKKLSSETSRKGHTSLGKNVADRFFLPNMTCHKLPR